MCENTVHAIVSALGSSYDVLTLAHAVISELIYIDRRRHLLESQAWNLPVDPPAGEDILPWHHAPARRTRESTSFPVVVYPSLRVWSLNFEAVIYARCFHSPHLAPPTPVHILDIGRRTISMLPNFAGPDGPRHR
jgi:hypothetical protein